MTALTGFDYANAFSQASEDVFQGVFGEKPTRGKPAFMMGATIKLQAVNIVVGVTGDLAGHVNFGMSLETAYALAGAMMMEEVTVLDEMSLSALSELANMVSGNARTYLNATGANSDITPPSVMQGDSITASWHNARAISVPLTLSQGEIVLTVGIRPKDSQA